MARPSDNSSYIYKYGTSPNTRTVVSQKNKIYSYRPGRKGMHQNGVTSEFGIDMSRGVTPVRGIGFGDVIAELVPEVSDPVTLSVSAALLYTMNLFQQFGYKAGVEGLARSLAHHRWPFDIRQELVISEIASGDLDGVGEGVKNATTQPGGMATGFITPIRAIFTFYERCWFSSYNHSYSSDSSLVMQSASISVTDVTDGKSEYGEYIDTGLAPISANGSPGAGYSFAFGGAELRSPLMGMVGPIG